MGQQFQTQLPSNTVIIDVEYYNSLLTDSIRVKEALENLRTNEFLCTEDMFRILGDKKKAKEMRDARIAERDRALSKLSEQLKEGTKNGNE